MAIDSLPAALFFAVIFVFGWRLRAFRSERTLMSLGAGVSAAYVFMHLLPELNQAGDEFVEATAKRVLPAPHLRVYFSALLGFLMFYGLENLRASIHTRRAQGTLRFEHLATWTSVAGFAIYVALVGYLLVSGITEEAVPIAQYAAAMGLHFFGVGHWLDEEFGSFYRRIGRFMLAGAALVGWGLGASTELSKPVVITLLGLVSGGVVMNSMIQELSNPEDHHYGAFVLGALVYALLLAFIH